MKKFYAGLLTVAMLTAMSATAVGATTLDGQGAPNPATGKGEGSYTLSVDAKYSDGIETPDVVSVDVEWGAMEFTYAVGGTKNWNAQTHSYTISNSTAGWSANGNGVKVTNHSNVAVNATFTYAAENNNTMTGSFAYDNNKAVDNSGAIKLNQGLVNQKDNADHVTATLTLSGTPADTMTEFTKVGTITVGIAKDVAIAR